MDRARFHEGIHRMRIPDILGRSERPEFSQPAGVAVGASGTLDRNTLTAGIYPTPGWSGASPP